MPNCIHTLLKQHIPTPPTPTLRTQLKLSRHNSFDLSTLYWVEKGQGTWICKMTALLFTMLLVKRMICP